MSTLFQDAESLIEYYSSQMEKPVQNYAGYMSTKALDDFSLQLVNYRIDHQLNQKQFAEVLGISQPMVSQYEAGTNNVTINRLCEICEKIGVRVRIDYESVDSDTNNYSNNPYKCDMELTKLNVA